MDDFSQDNYFKLFGLSSNSMELDLDKLEDKFFELQLAHHPDKFSHSSVEEKNNSAFNSSIINKAYYVLQDDFLRAEYWLSINGYDEAEINKIKLSQQFLMEAFEWREQLFEMNGSERLEFMSSLQKRYAAILADFSQYVSSNNKEPAALCFVELRFLKRFLEENG